MIRVLRIWLLRWRCFWCEIALDIDRTQIALHTPSLERNKKRLARLEFELDQLYAPQSIIMQALDRSRK